MTVTTDAPRTAGGRPSAPPPERPLASLKLVIAREVRSRGRTRSYLVSTLFSIALLVGLIVVPNMLTGGATTYELGVAGAASADIADAAVRLAEADEDVAIEVTAYPDTASGAEALREGEVEAVLLDGTRVLVARTGGFGSTPLADLLQQAAAAEQVRELVGDADAAPVEAALRGEALEVQPLTGQDAAQTEARTWLAYGGALLMWFLIIGYGTWALNGVTEEKANRVIEILLAAAPAWQLFAGKVIGIAILGLGQFVLLVGAALVAIRVTGAFELPVLPVDFAGVLTLWVLLGFAMYLVLFGCAGALASKIEDAQSAMSPIMSIALVGFFASFSVLGNPDGVVAVVGTFVPFMAPFVVPIRAALETIPLWQHLVAIGLAVATAVGLTLFAGRVYRGGALQFAGKVAWRQALRHHD